jgi:hypothetical protein
MHKQRPGPIPNDWQFQKQFRSRLSPRKFATILHALGPRLRQAKLLPAYQLIMGLVFHFLQPCGRLAAHMKRLSGIELSDAALAQRRARLPWQIFEEILRLVLRPLAEPKNQPGAFYHGLRLVGMDGTMFSVFNTPWISKSLKKAISRRAKAAFAKLRVCSLMELGVHNPLAVRIGRAEESELMLAYRLIEALPPRSLLLGDRLYGVGTFLVAFLARFAAGPSDALVRVGKQHKGRLCERLADGSVVLAVVSLDEQGQKQEILVRQICGIVCKRGRGRRTVRLWTTLLDAQQYPAAELLALYARRWEHELANKQCKVDLHGGDLLSSYTVETAMQEVAALLIGQSLVAEVRLAVADGAAVEASRISFVKVLDELRMIWWLFARIGHSMSERQKRAVIADMQEALREQMTPKRRSRSSPRAVRQPVCGWPRKLKNQSWNGETRYQVLQKHHGLS